MGEEDLDRERANRRASRARRLPPLIALAVGAACYGLLPSRLQLGPRALIPALILVLGVTLALTTTRQITPRSIWSRRGSIGVAALIIAANLVSLGLLVAALDEKDTEGTSLLLGGMQVWVTGVIGFGLLFWELDRGGAVARAELRRDEIQDADLRFSQDENEDAITEVAADSSHEGWMPQFVDYMYVSLTNSSAFSPTDTMPLTTRAKALMGLQATSALLVSLLIVSRAVSALSGS